jgi:hypothetical protein
MDSGGLPGWGVNWVWGLPLIVLTVVFHSSGLGLLNKKVSLRLVRRDRVRYPTASSNLLSGQLRCWPPCYKP